MISVLPFLVNYTTLPVVADAPLLPRDKAPKYPLAIFSHGLGGNFNTYSAVCTSLASFGIVCVAPEHRDGSAPVTLIRSVDADAEQGKQKLSTMSIGYQRHPHTATAEVLNSRNAQLRIRLWELEQSFTVLASLNSGDKTFTNYASPESTTPTTDSSFLKDALDMRPGRVTWVGHSFGAATMVQFVKSVYYHQSLPSLKGTPYENDLDWRPLHKPSSNSDLVKQITPESPMALLDLWAMPLRSDLTSWLWERPLPCHDRKSPNREEEGAQGHVTPNVVAVVTAEFHKYTDLLNRMKAALSINPPEAMAALERRQHPSQEPSSRKRTMPTPPNKAAFDPEMADARADDDGAALDDAELNAERLSLPPSAASSTLSSRASSPCPSQDSVSSNSSVESSPSADESSRPSASSSTTSITPSLDISSPNKYSFSPVEPKLYLIPDSAHLSQSDFGVLFPRLTRYLMNAQEPVETINLNVRAILAVMRGVGLEVEPYRSPEADGKKERTMDEDEDESENYEVEDTILTERCKEKRFLPVSLTD
jgi:hypothetical protein